jgi:hypothetical protein
VRLSFAERRRLHHYLDERRRKLRLEAGFARAGAARPGRSCTIESLKRPGDFGSWCASSRVASRSTDATKGRDASMLASSRNV